MSHAERTGARSLTYSGWHRPSSIHTYISRREAARLGMIDIDACEYCVMCRTPLALIETQESEHAPKPAPVMARLAFMAGIDAYSVSIRIKDQSVAGFAVRKLNNPSTAIVEISPEEYAWWLVGLRDKHQCSVAGTDTA